MGEVSYLPLIEDMVWSYSRIETFDSCPYRFFLKYIRGCRGVDKFYASYGTYIHRIIESYYLGRLSKEELLPEYLTGFSENVKGARPPKGSVAAYIKGGAAYLRDFQPFPYNMLGIEKRVNFQIDGLPFTGYIDFLGESGGELYIVDNKARDLKPRSGRKKSTAKDKELDTMLRQLYLYAVAVEQELGKFPKSLCLNCYRTGVFLEEPFQEEACMEAVMWAKSKVKEIKEADDFPPAVDYFPCTFLCPVSEDCIYFQLMKEGRKKKRESG